MPMPKIADLERLQATISLFIKYQKDMVEHKERGEMLYQSLGEMLGFTSETERPTPLDEDELLHETPYQVIPDSPLPEEELLMVSTSSEEEWISKIPSPAAVHREAATLRPFRPSTIPTARVFRCPKQPRKFELTDLGDNFFDEDSSNEEPMSDGFEILGMSDEDMLRCL